MRRPIISRRVSAVLLACPIRFLLRVRFRELPSFAELRARIDRADSEVDREMSADQMNRLLDARKKIHEARK